MLKEQAQLVTKINVVTDTVSVFAAFWLAYAIRSSFGGLLGYHYYDWLLLVIIPLWILLLNHFGFYSSLRTSSFSKQALALCKVHVCGAIVVAAAIYFVDPKGFSRSFFGIFIILAYVLISSVQILVRSFLRFIRLQGYNYRNILLVGTRQTAVELVDLIEMHKDWGLRIIGIIQPDSGELLKTVRGHEVLGRLNEIETVCRSHQVDEVIFCTTHADSRFDLSRYILILEEFGITVRTVLTLYNSYRSRTELNMFHDTMPLLTFHPTGMTVEDLFLKRCVDICGGLVGIVLLLLLTPFLALAIRLESPGPIFFGQTRVGQNGRRFTCWKFRSMFVDAEERKQELLHLNEMEGAIFKIKNDPRITKVGRFLRKTSLDELPQFWNILCGEMSLVGTRPPTPDEVHSYENWQRKRICIKPGLTGLWQVSGRNSISDFNEIVGLDLKYIENWSLLDDFKLLFRTVKVVFLREGAR